jgi:hypothetical protein
VSSWVSTTIEEKCNFFARFEMLSPATDFATMSPPKAQTARKESFRITLRFVRNDGRGPRSLFMKVDSNCSRNSIGAEPCFIAPAVRG